ncbi:hypothetical protein V8B97DRAFT_1921014 [Scleroderma yunnanense]
MSADELAAAWDTAEQWNKTHPPPELQSQAAEKMGRQYAQQFAQEVWKQCRMQVVVMATWKGPDRDVLTSLYLMTGAVWKIGGASMPRTSLPEDSEDEAPVRKKAQKGQKKPKYQLHMSLNGNLQIPVILNMASMERKALMCTFAAFHYMADQSPQPKAAGKRKTQGNYEYNDPEYTNSNNDMYDSKADLDNWEGCDLNHSDTTSLEVMGKTPSRIKGKRGPQLKDIHGSNEVKNQGDNDPPTMSLDAVKVRPQKKSKVHTSVGSCGKPISHAGEVSPGAQPSEPQPGNKNLAFHAGDATMSFHSTANAASCGPIPGQSVQGSKPKPHQKVNTSHTGNVGEVVHNATVPAAHQSIWDRKPPKWADHDLPTPPAKK